VLSLDVDSRLQGVRGDDVPVDSKPVTDSFRALEGMPAAPGIAYMARGKAKSRARNATVQSLS
jgi:hypothetical protein